MTKAELVSKLNEFPDNAIIVVSSFDHSYQEVRRISLNMAEKYSDRTLAEFYKGQELAKGSTLVDVVRIGE